MKTLLAFQTALSVALLGISTVTFAHAAISGVCATALLYYSACTFLMIVLVRLAIREQREEKESRKK